MDEQEQYLAQLEAQIAEERARSAQMNQQMASTMFNAEDSENLIRWQLDIKEELERIEHLLRKHIPKRDEDGNEYFIESSKENQLFNETGVQEILNILAWYLNKNIILSNYDADQIDLRVHQFGRALTNFIFLNYEKFGLDTSDKIKHFPMVVLNIVNTVEASYNRALKGGERESLRTARTVMQSEPIGGMGYGSKYPMIKPPTSKKFSLIKPSTWT
jgi:hypothetical protein